jgi:nucleoid-associated protein YgaU
MWSVVAASAATLVVSTVIPATLRALVAAGRQIQPLSRPIATIVAAILLVGAVRSSPSSAIVPPPTERVVVDEERTTAAVAVRNPVSAMVPTSSAISAYTVAVGDTLWGIARHILDQAGAQSTGAQIATAWKTIYEANTDVVGADPNLILPGQILTIPGGVHG